MGLYEEVRQLVGNNILLIFGKPGTGKTTFCIELAKDALKQGKKVLYVDTEYGVSEDEVPCDMAHAPNLDELDKLIKSPEVKKEYDVIIVDSVGMLIYPHMSRKGLKERSEMFLQRGAIMFTLREYAALHKKLIVMTTQPNYFGEESGTELEGAKYLHLAKEQWISSIVNSNPAMTLISISTYVSRKFGRGKELYRLRITSKGVEVIKRW